MRLDLSQAELKREQLDVKLQKKILKLYKDAAKDIGKKIKSLPKTSSAELQKQQLKVLQKQIDAAYAELYNLVDSQIQTDMKAVIEGVIQDNRKFLESLGLPGEGAFSHVPSEIVESIVSGNLYKGNWSLSKAIWGGKKKTQSDVESIIAKGIAENLSAYDIGKALEQYVDPAAKKDWQWSKVYPGTAKRIDYNAQRLARTMVSHAYQQSFVRTTKDNPFVTKYRWRSAGGERMCEICQERNGKLFDKDKLPLDHPNGRCTFIAEIPDSMEDIADKLADWSEGKPNPSIDAWYRSIYDKDPPDYQKSPESKDSSVIEYKRLSDDDAQEYTDNWAIKAFGEGVKNLTKAEKESVYSYTGDSYRAINSYLRGGKIDKGGSTLTSSQIKTAARTLSELVSKTKVQENLKVFRGGVVKEFGGVPAPGSILKNKSLLSTSCSYSIAERFTQYATRKGYKGAPYLLELDITAGSSAIPATSISKLGKEHGWLNEAEVLLGVNQSIRVTYSEYDSNLGAWIIKGVIDNG